MSIIKSSLTILFLSLMISTNIKAQSLSMQNLPNQSLTIGASFGKAFYSGEISPTAFSGVYDIFLNVPLSSKIHLSIDVPYIATKYDREYYDWGNVEFDEKGFGNVYAGLEFIPASSEEIQNIFAFGLYLPTAKDEAGLIGMYTDYYKLQKYLSDYLGIYGNYSLQNKIEEGFIYSIEAGPDIIIPTEDHGNDTEFFIHYGLSAGYKFNKFAVRSELTGIAFISTDIDKFTDRFFNSLGLLLSYQMDNITFMLKYKIYTRDDMRDFVDGVLSLGVSIALN